MKKTRLSLKKFGKQTLRKEMLDKVSGGYTISTVQEYCHTEPNKTSGGTKPRIIMD